MTAIQRNLALKYGLLVFAGLLVAFLYIYRLGDKALDFDERYSLNIATAMGGHSTNYEQSGQYVALPFSGRFFYTKQYHQRSNVANVVTTAMNDNGHGLPYFLLLHIWLKFVGISVWSARLPSAILMLLAVILMYALLRKCSIRFYIALPVTLLFACNGVIIGLAQYLRFYSMGIVLTLLSTRLLLGIQSDRRTVWRWIILGILWAVMFLTQFLLALVVFAQALFAFHATKSPHRIKALLLAGTFFMAIVGIWLVPLHGWETFRNIYNMHTVKRDLLIPIQMTLPATPGNVLLSLLGSLSGAVGQPVSFGDQKAVSLLQILVGFPAIALIVTTLVSNREVARFAWLRLSLLVIATYSLASVIHAAISGYTLLFQGRYWVFSYPFAYLMLAFALQHFPKVQKGSIRFIAITAIILTTVRAFYTSASALSGLSLSRDMHLRPSYIQPNPDYEGLATLIAHISRDRDTISYNSWRVSQNVNCFLPTDFARPQRVDLSQTAPAIIIRDGEIQTLAVPLARTLHARPLWQH